MNTPEMKCLAGRIAINCAKNLDRNRVSAVGVGLFAGIIWKGQMLLRNREETNSLIYDQDLSGKWELPGGGVDLNDLAAKGDYTGTIFNTLKHEIEEETGLILHSLEENLCLLPAWLTDVSTGQVDLAFVTVIRWSQVEVTKEFEVKQSEGKIKFFPLGELLGEDGPTVISPRMKFLIKQGVNAAKM